MSNLSKGSPNEGRRTARRRDDFERDLELLVQRLADSREAIVRILAAAAGEEGVLQGLPRGPVAPLRVLPSPPGAPEAIGPEGPTQVELGTVAECPSADEADQSGAVPSERDLAAGDARAARRRLLAVVLVAVGAVVVLTALVSLL
jgi:hypothetical protein